MAWAAQEAACQTGVRAPGGVEIGFEELERVHEVARGTPRKKVSWRETEFGESERADRAEVTPAVSHWAGHLPQGVRRISPVTRAEEFYYPPWKRLLFQLLVSLPLCLACLACVFLLMLGCFQLQVT